ncbi:MAG: IS1 family transposase [Clostridiaceae bacterium]|nr:IS1 family transposase [Clostridiaceae bacterium]
MEVVNKIINILEVFRINRTLNGLICAHCESQNVIHYGTYNKKQRYKCKTCKKTFTDFTNSPLNMCHFPDKWPEFIKCTIKGLSLRESARLLKVSHVTLFYWRHKFLIALKTIKNTEFIGSVELADIFLAYSSFCKEKKIVYNHTKIKGYNINSGRNYLNNFLNWMRRFKGIASKYTNNYLSWFKFVNRINFDGTTKGIIKLIKIMSSQYIYEINLSIRKQRLDVS